MNILFVLYGGIETNSFLCLSRFAKELNRRGHRCAAVLHGAIRPWEEKYLTLFTARQVLNNPERCFAPGEKAEVIHAWTPRQNVADFVTKYQAANPTPLFIYSEDDEESIARSFLRSSSKAVLQKIGSFLKQQKIPSYLSDPSHFRHFLALADAAGMITPELQKDFPTSFPLEVLFPGVDLNEFFPREPSAFFKEKYSLDPSEKLILYCGGLGPLTSSSLRDLCQMVLWVNRRGSRCRLIRSGIGKLSKIDDITKEELEYVLDLGILPRAQIPDLMSLADVFVQPGRPSSFEAGRLPCKIIEFMAMGVPTVLPHCNAPFLIERDREAMIHETGLPEEMAACCEKIFQDPSLRDRLKLGARQFAEKYFDIQKKVDQLEQLYQKAECQYTSRGRKSVY